LEAGFIGARFADPMKKISAVMKSAVVERSLRSKFVVAPVNTVDDVLSQLKREQAVRERKRPLDKNVSLKNRQMKMCRFKNCH
jgi:hypothetical protein